MPSASPMAGSAGSMMSIDSAVSAIIMRDEPDELGRRHLLFLVRRGGEEARLALGCVHDRLVLLVGPAGPESGGTGARLGRHPGQNVASHRA